MKEIFSVESNLEWLNRIPTYIDTIFMGHLRNNGVFNEIHNDFKRFFFKRKKVNSEHVGVWGWNSWCGIHTFPILTSGKVIETYRKTVDVGFDRLESETGLLPHAIIHRNGVFGSEHTYRCYEGGHGEAYNVDNILCWAKMAMEYFLVTGDSNWFNKEKMKIIENTIDFFLNNNRDKFNPKLLHIGVEGDWTECTNWNLDNSNINVNMLRTLQLAIECQKLLGFSNTQLDYQSEYSEIKENFNKPYTEGGFWHPELGFYIHGNNGNGTQIHGDKYFESTTNYFSILWDIAPKSYQLAILEYLDKNSEKIEFPYPVLTNYLPRTGARRKNYGKTVTNGDIWLVLGAHAAAARLQSGGSTNIKTGSKMYKSIIDYEIEHGIIHNSIYQNGTTNDSWDPEVANYGAPFAPFVLGLLGIKLTAEGIKFNIKSLIGLEYINMELFLFQKRYRMQIKWKNTNQNEESVPIFDEIIMQKLDHEFKIIDERRFKEASFLFDQ